MQDLRRQTPSSYLRLAPMEGGDINHNTSNTDSHRP
ncbi:hypothetical protein [Escherichia phage PH1061]|nr:hypothetical protein [Escherichia phage PH1061]